MKKILVLFVALTVLFTSFAAVTVEAPPTKASEIFLPVGKSGQKISLLELSQISVKDFEALSGQKMKFFEKAGFKLAQRDLRKSINEDGTLNNKNLDKLLKKADDGSGGFHLGGFALGFLLGLIGVLVAYLINDDKKRTRVKWAWLGVATILVLYLLLHLI